MFEVRRAQLPVGQGGFHIAELDAGGTPFRYVYDCGSDQTRALERECQQFSRRLGVGRRFDLLAVSHLHRDHVNGVEGLLARHDVDTVLLPYLHPCDRVAVVAAACANGALTPSAMELAVDPGHWFRERGAKRVAFVLPSTDREDEAPVPAPRESDGRTRGDGDTPLRLVGIGEANDVTRNRYPMLGIADADVVFPGTSLSVDAGSTPLWLLSPFTHPEPDRMGVFFAAASRILGLPELGADSSPLSLSSHLKAALADKSLRRALGVAYELVREDRNLSSMSLYSGPVSAPTGHLYVADSLRGRWRHREARVGWIGTGDSMLRHRDRVREFERYYARVLSTVSTFVVPHHGAAENFSAELLRQELDSPIWVLAVGKNGHGHPDRELVRRLNDRGSVVAVRSGRRSGFYEHIAME